MIARLPRCPRRRRAVPRWSPAGRDAGPGRGRRPRRALALVTALVGIACAAPARTESGLDELIAKAARQGSVRVIVEVRPEGPAPPDPAAIARAQDQVLQELAGTGHRVLRRYATIPFLALTVSADALRRLAGSLFVSGIREDRVLRPQGAPGSP